MSAPNVPSPTCQRPTHFGTALFELRATRGLTQRRLGKLSGLQPSAVSDLENLRRPPPREEQVAALSRALTCDVHQDLLLHSLARAERRATHGLRISRRTPPRVAQLLRDIALIAERLSDRHVAALRAQLREVPEMK
jgi:transcriptional regulator with XRE-family HTH domain